MTTSVLSAGDRIHVRDLGEGIVLKLRPQAQVQVRLDAAPELPRTVAVSDCKLVDDVVEATTEALAALTATPTRTATPKPYARPRQNAVDRADLRQTIEAIRLGIVPARHVARYTVGRELEINALEQLFFDRKGLRVVWGDYGAGKTHILDLAEQKALESGFVAARVVIDPRENKVTNPKRLYETIVASLRYPEGIGQGLDPLMQRLIDSKDHRSHLGGEFSRFFSPYLHVLHVGDDEGIGWMRDYLGGDTLESFALARALRHAGYRGPTPLALSDYRTYGRMYAHMLSTLAAWTEDAGFRGLVLLFDEVEFVDELNRENLRWAIEVLSHVAAICLPPESLGFDPELLYRGGHAVHQALPLRFRDDQPLAAVYALTPLSDIRMMMDRIVEDEALSIDLRTLGARELPKLVATIASLYADAYPDFVIDDEIVADFIPRIEDEIANGGSGARLMVRSTVQHLDAIRWEKRRS
ncbi:MAG: DUF2791 family P-loop domain-containing protein [Planctomycetes bacterium]|nr:DUF2791 family P-loop domain-containing protein [Planctomycetota bacterium]